MQVQRFSDLAQHQRSHRDFPMLEKMALAVNDCLGHAQDGVEALLYIFDQPSGLLQLARQLLMAGVAVALQNVSVKAIDAEARHSIRIERRQPNALRLLNDDVGNDVAGIARRKAGAGPGI